MRGFGLILFQKSEMIGTIRTLDADMKEVIRERMKSLVPAIAKIWWRSKNRDSRRCTDYL